MLELALLLLLLGSRGRVFHVSGVISAPQTPDEAAVWGKWSRATEAGRVLI